MRAAFSLKPVDDVSDIEHAIAAFHSSDLRDSDTIVIRVTMKLWCELMVENSGSQQAIAQARNHIGRRIPGFEILVMLDGASIAEEESTFDSVCNDFIPRILDIAGAHASVLQPLDSEKLDLLRSEELKSVIEKTKNRSVIRSASNYHFVLPSGAHTSQFLRLAESFVDVHTVDRIAFWIALDIIRSTPVIPLRACLVVDNPSILILAARTKTIYRIYAIARSSWPDISSFPNPMRRNVAMVALSLMVFCSVHWLGGGRR